MEATTICDLHVTIKSILQEPTSDRYWRVVKRVLHPGLQLANSIVKISTFEDPPWTSNVPLACETKCPISFASSEEAKKTLLQPTTRHCNQSNFTATNQISVQPTTPHCKQSHITANNHAAASVTSLQQRHTLLEPSTRHCNQPIAHHRNQPHVTVTKRTSLQVAKRHYNQPYIEALGKHITATNHLSL